jgi:outer membrane lipopolysaccharide assembly protein LptE/RlpB
VKVLVTPSRTMLKRVPLLLACAVAMVVAGCGYHFGAEGAALPAQAKTIYVEKFRNRSRFTGINDQFARYMEDEIANHKRLEVVDDPATADLVLAGELVYVETAPLATNAVNEPIDYSLTLTANATLTDQHTHRVVWSAAGMAASEVYAVVAPAVVTTSPQFLEQNMRAKDIANLTDIEVARSQQRFSQEQALQTLAQNIYSSMAEGF